MKALVKYEKGVKKFALKEIEIPEPSDDDVQIKIAYGGICGTDIHIYHDTYADAPPFVIGHEFSGTITKVGTNVKNLAIGDRVVSETNQSYCGVCDLCQDARYCLCNDRKALGQKTDGVFAEYAIVKSSNIFKIADHLDLKTAALAEPLSCVVHAMMERSTVQAGDLVLVSGPGPIGLIATMLAVKQGGKIIVSGTTADEERMKLAKELGAYKTVDVMTEDIKAVIDKETNGRGCDVVLECSGFGGAIQTGFEVLKKRGIFTQIGLTGKPTLIDTDLLCYREIDYRGCLSKTNWSWRRTVQLMESKELPLDKIISHVFDLQDWQEAITTAEQRKGVKVFFDISKGLLK